jgi:hypothetical protein
MPDQYFNTIFQSFGIPASLLNSTGANYSATRAEAEAFRIAVVGASRAIERWADRVAEVFVRKIRGNYSVKRRGRHLHRQRRFPIRVPNFRFEEYRAWLADGEKNEMGK